MRKRESDFELVMSEVAPKLTDPTCGKLIYR